MSEFNQLTQEQMVELSKQANSGVNDPGISEEESAARAAAAAAAQTGSQNAEQLNAAPVVSEEQGTPQEPETPETPASPETPADPATAAEPETPAEPFPTSEDIHLNSALNVMKAAGMSVADLNTHFGDAIKTGDVSKVDQAALREAVGDDNAVLVMAGVSQWAAGAGSAALAAVRDVHASVGGSENWSKMTAWAKELVAADPSKKAAITDITEMLNGNALSRKLGAAEFQKLYNADPKNATIGGAPVISKGTTPAAPATVKPLNPSDAYAAKERLYRQRDLGKIKQADFNTKMAEIRRGVAAHRNL